jgi:predicted phosphodiesterase
MRTQAAFLADVHGNLPALEAVLADIARRGVENVYFLGDVLGKGPAVGEVISLLRASCAGAVYGNWDRLVLTAEDGERFGVPYYRERLTGADRAYVETLPETLALDFCGRSVLAYHGRHSIDCVVTPMFNNERANVEKAMYRFGPHDVTIMGDAHHPFIFTHQGRYLMNTGAVGNPCDRITQASYLILTDEDGVFSAQHVRVPYDRARAVGLALRTPELPMLSSYINETATARYSRSYKPKSPPKNAWQELPLETYEAHMSAASVRQAQALDRLMAEQMRDLPARSVCILGVSGGNGLEHAAALPYARILGVDINADYLAACRARFPALGDRLRLLNLDLTDLTQTLPHAELVLADLLIEYIGVNAFAKQIASCAPHAVSCVLQHSGSGDFVSPSPEAAAFSGIEKLHREIDPTTLTDAMEEMDYHLTLVSSTLVPDGKLLLRLDYERTAR